MLLFDPSYIPYSQWESNLGCGGLIAQPSSGVLAISPPSHGLHKSDGNTAVEIHRTISAEYESVDTERDLETAVEAAPELLFPQPVTLLARQHGITTPEGRNVIDLVFLHAARNALLLVEAKRGRLIEEHYRQLRRYLDCAHQSRLLRRHVEKGASPRGVLITVEAGGCVPADPAVVVQVVAKPDVIAVLKRLRAARTGGQAAP